MAQRERFQALNAQGRCGRCALTVERERLVYGRTLAPASIDMGLSCLLCQHCARVQVPQ